jgi:hypothetical protein
MNHSYQRYDRPISKKLIFCTQIIDEKLKDDEVSEGGREADKRTETTKDNKIDRSGDRWMAR